MSAHDVGVSVDQWQAARLAVLRRVRRIVVDLATRGEGADAMMGDLALAVSDLEAMDRLSNGHPIVPVEVRDPATD